MTGHRRVRNRMERVTVEQSSGAGQSERNGKGTTPLR
jgi:hypothetical protein